MIGDEEKARENKLPLPKIKGNERTQRKGEETKIKTRKVLCPPSRHKTESHENTRRKKARTIQIQRRAAWSVYDARQGYHRGSTKNSISIEGQGVEFDENEFMLAIWKP